MNKKIARMMNEIERRGGVVDMSTLPDDLAEFFLAEVLDCPDCLAEALRNGGTLPEPIRRTTRKRNIKGH